jgi:hypothetical protein
MVNGGGDGEAPRLDEPSFGLTERWTKGLFHELVERGGVDAGLELQPSFPLVEVPIHHGHCRCPATASSRVCPSACGPTASGTPNNCDLTSAGNASIPSNAAADLHSFR